MARHEMMKKKGGEKERGIGHQEETTVSKAGRGTQCPAAWFPVVLKHWGNFQREKVVGSTMNTDFLHCMLESLVNIEKAL